MLDDIERVAEFLLLRDRARFQRRARRVHGMDLAVADGRQPGRFVHQPEEKRRVIDAGGAQTQTGRLDHGDGAAHAGHCIGSVSSWYIT
ncbi:hypothetical protein D3C87_1720560 [compost metagenome]